MKKILIIFGTRPEAIKIAPIIEEFRKRTNDFKLTICVTGQHRQLLDQVLGVFDITPDYDLNIMVEEQTLNNITINVMKGVSEIIKKTNPDLVLVHGDTNTSTASALAAFYNKIKVGHIEAGLRTHQKYNPYPEEVNRCITAQIATYHFAPTERNKENLIKENCNQDNIFVTGNTVVDSVFSVANKINTDSKILQQTIKELTDLGFEYKNLKEWGNGLKKMVLVTCHRRENFGNNFVDICEAIKNAAEKHENVDFVFPVHLNPNIRKVINKIFNKNYKKNKKVNNELFIYKNIFFIEPLEYISFIYLLKLSYFILTDSGGIQEEAICLNKPVLLLRDYTERQEGVDLGVIKLVGSNKGKIAENIDELINKAEVYNSRLGKNLVFGIEGSSKIIVQKIKDALNG